MIRNIRKLIITTLTILGLYRTCLVKTKQTLCTPPPPPPVNVSLKLIYSSAQITYNYVDKHYFCIMNFLLVTKHAPTGRAKKRVSGVWGRCPKEQGRGRLQITYRPDGNRKPRRVTCIPRVYTTIPAVSPVDTADTR